MKSSHYAALDKVIRTLSDTTQEITAPDVASCIETLMNTIQYIPLTPLFWTSPYDQDRIQAIPTPMTRAILLTAEHCSKLLTGPYPIYQHHPDLAIFMRGITTDNLMQQLRDYAAIIRPNGLYHQGEDYQRILKMTTRIKSFIGHLWETMRDPAYRTNIYQARRKSKDNYQSLLEYIDALFARYARLLVLRIDFEYQEGHVIQSEEDILVKYMEARDDRVHLFHNMDSNRLFEHMVGHAWKLEYGIERGYHYHMLLFFDGRMVREDKTLAMLIGEYWNDTISPLYGSYFNCNGDKKRYTKPGIGMINHDEWDKRKWLNEAAKYLTKPDYLAQALISGQGRTFGHGEIESPTAHGPGRPRSQPTEMA